MKWKILFQAVTLVCALFLMCGNGLFAETLPIDFDDLNAFVPPQSLGSIVGSSFSLPVSLTSGTSVDISFSANGPTVNFADQATTGFGIAFPPFAGNVIECVGGGMIQIDVSALLVREVRGLFANFGGLSYLKIYYRGGGTDQINPLPFGTNSLTLSGTGDISTVEIYGEELVFDKLELEYLDELWVDDDAAPGGDGSQANPYQTIGEAMNVALAGCTIWVQPGLYLENVNMIGGINLFGSGAEVTIIDGGGSGAVITASGLTAHSTIAGFTITNGDPGIGCYFSTATIRNNIITNTNLASSSADGIRLDNSDPAYIYNNVIYQVGGMGIRFQGNSSGEIINNTIYDCRYYAGIGMAALSIGPVSPVIKNNIIVRGNTEPVSGIVWRDPATPQLSYNDVVLGGPSTGYYRRYDVGLNIWVEESGGPGALIEQDPMFVDAGIGAFRLQAGSPCIDAGDPDPAYNDADGSRNDIGAYGGPSLEPGASYHAGTGFIFTTIGKIPVSEITQTPGDQLGLANVSPEASAAFHITQYTDSPFGGSLWIYGLFGASDPVDYYRILVREEGTVDYTPLSVPLNKVLYIINPDGTVSANRINLGPKTIGDISNLYKLNKEGYWTYPDLRMVWYTGGISARYELTYEAYQGDETSVVPVALDPNDQDHIFLYIDNTALNVQIHSVKYNDGTSIPECQPIRLPHAGNEDLLFTITASHPTGFLNSYRLDCYWGYNHHGGLLYSDQYVGVHDSPPPYWTGEENFELPPNHPSEWRDCAYRFRLYAIARTTNGYNYINDREFNVYYALDYGPSEVQIDSPGWHLFSSRSKQPVEWLDSLVDDGLGPISVEQAELNGWIQGEVYYFDGGLQQYEISPGDDQYLRWYRGYWLYSNRGGLTLTLP